MTFLRNTTLDGAIDIGPKGQEADIIHQMGLPDHYVPDIYKLIKISAYDGELMVILTLNMEIRIICKIGRETPEFQKMRARHLNHINKRRDLILRMIDICEVREKSFEKSHLIDRSEIREWVKKANEIFDEARKDDATMYESQMTESIDFGVEFPSLEEISSEASITQSAEKIRRYIAESR